MTAFQAPKGVATVTTTVFADEPCFYLIEENRLSEDSRTMCRFQLLKVVRDDTLVTAYVNLGPSSNFNADGFNMVGGWIDDSGRGEAVHTVAELQAGADELRSRKPHRELEPWDIGTSFKEHIEERGRRGKSTFGYKGQLVR